MSAQAIPAVLSPEPKTETKRKALPRVRIRLGSHTVVRLPGPEALLHPPCRGGADPGLPAAVVGPVEGRKEGMDMAAVAEDLVVLPIRPQRKADPREVVAVVLADGSVRDLRGSGTRSSDARDWASGSVSGDDWTLWWERRRFSG